MRLIDVDKLSEHKFTRESAKSSDYMRGWNDCIDTIIDNAPTVEGEILTKEAYSDLCLRASCDNCIENECEVNGYVCPLYKKYQESKETEKMNNKEALKIASWWVNNELCEEDTEYCQSSCRECCREVQKRLLKMAQEAENNDMR